jgi:hypothetical protein
MSEVSMFPTYSKENETTNFCLRMMKLIYEEHPRLLEEFLSNLLDERVESLGLKIQQQVKREAPRRVMDGLIQNPLSDVCFEFKAEGGSFDETKLNDYLELLKTDKENGGFTGLIAVGTDDQIWEIDDGDVTSDGDLPFFYRCTYGEFVESLRTLDLPGQLDEFTSELEEYLNQRNLLPEWEHKLVVVPCTNHFDEVVDGKRYMTPAKTGVRSYQKCKYFGAYKDKKVQALAEIKAVVDVYDNSDESQIYWSNPGWDKDNLIEEATAKAERDPRDTQLMKEEGCRTFLFDGLKQIEFSKDSKHGIQNKKYFDVSGIDAEGLTDLAEELDGKSWSEVEQS